MTGRCSTPRPHPRLFKSWSRGPYRRGRSCPWTDTKLHDRLKPVLSLLRNTGSVTSILLAETQFDFVTHRDDFTFHNI